MTHRHRYLFFLGACFLFLAASSGMRYLDYGLRAQDAPTGAGQEAAPVKASTTESRDEASSGDSQNGDDLDRPDAEGGAAAEEPGDKSMSVLNMILESGTLGIAFMLVLGVFSIVAVTVAVERAINMQRSKIMPPRFVHELEDLVSRGADPDAFRQLCEATPSPIASVLSAGLLRHGRSILEVEKSMEDAIARELAELRSKIRPLGVMGSVAPLVGLQGTVVGMIIAFYTASQTGLGRAELLAEGIYLALLTTAGGLTVAIPAVLLAAYFNSRAEKFIREMDVRLMPVMPCLARFESFQVAQSGMSADGDVAAPAASGKQELRNPLLGKEPMGQSPATLSTPSQPTNGQNRPAPVKLVERQGQPQHPSQGTTSACEPAKAEPLRPKPVSKPKTTSEGPPPSRRPGRNPLIS